MAESKPYDSCVGEQALLEHVVGELSPDDRLRVEEHLRCCAACRLERRRLETELAAIGDGIEGDNFPSRDAVRRARRKLLDHFDAYELSRADPLLVLRRAEPLPWRQVLTAAAAAVVCLSVAGAWLWQARRPQSAAAGILQEATQLEALPAGGTSFQQFQVEISSSGTQSKSQSGSLRIWSDPAKQRSVSKWLDEKGALRYAVWNHADEASVGSTIYDPSRGQELIPAVWNPDAQGNWIQELQPTELTCAALAASFLRWIGRRGMQPVSLAGGVRRLVDQYGLTVELSRVATVYGDIIRIAAERPTARGLATLTLDVDPRTRRPLTLRLRYAADNDAVELLVRHESTRSLEDSNLDPTIFEPRLPGPVVSKPPPRAENATQPSITQAAPKSFKPGRRELLSAGVKARSAIHRAGLCLGSRILIRSGEASLVVEGVVDSGAEKERLLSQLHRARLPDWATVRIRTTQEATSASAVSEGDGPAIGLPEAIDAGSDPSELPVRPFRLPIQTELEAYFEAHPLPPPKRGEGSPNSAQDVAGRIMGFADRGVAIVEEAMVHAAVLNSLAQTYGNGAADELTFDASIALEEMLSDHLARSENATADARSWLGPVFAYVTDVRGTKAMMTARGTRPAQETQLREISWGAAVRQVFQAARQMQNSTTALLAVNASAPRDDAIQRGDSSRALADFFAALNSAETGIGAANQRLNHWRQTPGGKSPERD